MPSTGKTDNRHSGDYPLTDMPPTCADLPKSTRMTHSDVAIASRLGNYLSMCHARPISGWWICLRLSTR